MATDLLPEEWEVFDLGEPVALPPQLVGENVCYHASIWYLTETIVDVPENASYNGHTRENLEELRTSGILHWELPVFEATTPETVGELDRLLQLKTGTYLILLFDVKLGTGHWTVLEPSGIFEPGTQRKNVPLQKWVSIFSERYRLRRVFPISHGTADGKLEPL